MEKVYGMYEYVKWFVMLEIWSKSSKKSGIWVSVISESFLLIFMTWVNIQDEPRKIKSIKTLAV